MRPRCGPAPPGRRNTCSARSPSSTRRSSSAPAAWNPSATSASCRPSAAWWSATGTATTSMPAASTSPGTSPAWRTSCVTTKTPPKPTPVRSGPPRRSGRYAASSKPGMPPATPDSQPSPLKRPARWPPSSAAPSPSGCPPSPASPARSTTPPSTPAATCSNSAATAKPTCSGSPATPRSGRRTIWLHTAPLVVAAKYGGWLGVQAAVVLVVPVLPGGLAGVVAEDAAVVGLLAGDQAETVPALDAAGVGVEIGGDLVEGEQPAVLQPLVVTGQLVAAGELADPAAVPAVAVSAGVPGGVEVAGDLGVGMGVEEPGGQLGDLVGGLAALPGVKRDGQAQDVVAAAGEADGGGDGARAAGEGHVFDQQAGQALAFAHRGCRVRPQGGQVGGERADLVALRGVGDGGGLGGSAVVFAGVGQGAQRGVPVGFQGVGDEPVGGVDGQVAAAGGVGGVLGALHVKLPEMIGVLGLGSQLVGDGEGDLDGCGGEGVQDQAGDSGVDAVTGDVLADRLRGSDARVLAHVFGDQGAAAGVVADGHPAAAPAADGDALQQRGAFAGRAGGAVGSAGGGVGGQDGEVGLVGVPGDVAGMMIFDQDGPFRCGPGGGVRDSVQVRGVAGLAVGVGAGVGGVAQGAENPAVGEGLPEQLAAARAVLVAGGEGQLPGAEGLHDGEG